MGLAGVWARLKSWYVGAVPSSPAGETNATDRAASLRTALLLLLAGGVPLSVASITHLVYGILIAVGLAGLGYLQDLLRRKGKAYAPELFPDQATPPAVLPMLQPQTGTYADHMIKRGQASAYPRLDHDPTVTKRVRLDAGPGGVCNYCGGDPCHCAKPRRFAECVDDRD